MSRPRKSGDRYRCGKLKQRRRTWPMIDPGHKFLIAKRRMADPLGDGRDPRAGYPLGVANLRGMVCPALFDAGLRYGLLAWLVWGGAKTARSHLARLQPNERSEDDPPNFASEAAIERWLAGKEIELQEAVAVVQATGRRPFNVLENIVRHEHRMRFLDDERRQSPRALRVDMLDRAALHVGLAALAKHWQLDCP